MPSSRLADLHLPADEVQRLQAVLRDLLAQRPGPQADHWYEHFLRSVATLTASDKALLVLRSPNGGYQCAVGLSRDTLARYASRFADLDRSRVASSQYGLEIWSLEQLWQPGEFETSEYQRSFAVPNGLRGTIGLTLHLSNPRAELCLILHKGLDVPGETERRRAILGLLLEPIRAGFAVDLGARDESSGLSSLMDVTGQALALYAMDGHELAQNPVMRRVLNQDPEREALRGYLRDVARSVVATLGQGDVGQAIRRHQEDGTRREVATSQAAYRLRGNLVGRNTLGHGTAVLVSLDRVAFQVPAPDSIRARYGLTVRELQVASLLMHRLTNAEIARMLGISPHTARHHTENVLSKVGVRSRDGLRRAIQEPPPGSS